VYNQAFLYILFVGSIDRAFRIYTYRGIKV